MKAKCLISSFGVGRKALFSSLRNKKKHNAKFQTTTTTTTNKHRNKKSPNNNFILLLLNQNGEDIFSVIAFCLVYSPNFLLQKALVYCSCYEQHIDNLIRQLTKYFIRLAY